MKLLLDTCVWGGIRHELIEAGHDVIWSGEWDVDPGDEEILALAYRQNRILVTLDKDFGELAIVYQHPHAGIIRLVNIPARRQGLYCLSVLEKYSNQLLAAALITVTRDKVRIRLADEP
jgi:predicted nuclease of predicted toxin-antitoxin system